MMLIQRRATLSRITNLLQRCASGFWASLNKQRSISSYARNHQVRKLQLGCGPYTLEGWLNSSLYGAKDVVPIDVKKPLPIKSSTFHYVFFEHLIEHLRFSQGQDLVKECFRILKPGGKARIATPDIEFLIELYQPGKSPLQERYLRWATDVFLKDAGTCLDTAVINNFVRDWGHQFIYDYKTLKCALRGVGFVNIEKVSPGESSDPNLRNVESHWKALGKEFNDLETFVVEASKPSKD